MAYAVRPIKNKHGTKEKQINKKIQRLKQIQKQ